MAHQFRGENEFELGLGLPNLSTTARLAYTPPRKGYEVFDTDLDVVFTWDGAAWIETVTGNATDFATAAQGILAGTATQPGDNVSTLTNDSGFLTITTGDQRYYTETESDALFATAAQGATADTAVQPGDATSTLTNNDAFVDLTTAQTIAGIKTFSAKPLAPLTVGGDDDATLTTKGYVDSAVAAGAGGIATDDLTDVDTTTLTPATGHVLIHDGTLFVNRALVKADVSDFSDGDYATAAQGALADTALQNITAESVGDLSDVDITTVAPTDGQTLVWATDEFVPGTITADDRVLKAGDTMSGTLRLIDGFGGTANLIFTEDLDPTPYFSITHSALSATLAFDDAGGGNRQSITWQGDNEGLPFLAYSIGYTETPDALVISSPAGTFSMGATGTNFASTAKITTPSTVGGDGATVVTTKDYVDAEIAAVAAGAAGELDDLTDVTITSVATGHGLFYNGTVFANRSAVKADISDFTETDYVHTTGDETIAGNKTFSNNVIVNGDLTVNGTTTSVNTTDLEITDNVITVNSGEAGAGVTLGTAGITIDRGTSTNFDIVFDETDDKLKAGLTGALNPVALSYQTAFVVADWTAGTPNTYTITAATHGIPYVANEVFMVQVFDDTGNLTTVETQVNQTTGDVVIKTAGATFDGRVILVKG